MAAYNQHTSAIGLALKNKSAFVEIPKQGGMNTGRDNFTAVSTNPSRSAMLPTPPNSISPNLPPQRQGQESDVDLQDAPSNALTAEALDSLGDLNSVGAITPTLLAKHHLPEILVNHGPLAIRHIMSYLNSNVPGFARITSAKARRLVVAALEGRGSGVEIPGVDGEVLFEKVGWGRWDARRRGEPARDGTPPASYSSEYSGMQGLNRGDLSGASASGRYSSDEDHDMLEHEADKMSLDDEDENGGYASSEAPPDPMIDDFDDGDVTDEEDWESIGAEALRARSLPPGSLPKSRIPSGGGRIYQPIYPTRPARPAYHMAQSVPVKPVPMKRTTNNNFNTINDSQERAAVEALLSLGSM